MQSRWKSHKTECLFLQDKRYILRVSRLAQKAFFLVEANFYINPITAVHDDGTQIIFQKGGFDDVDNTAIVPLPPLELLGSYRNKEILLSIGGCNQALTYAFQIFDMMITQFGEFYKLVRHA